MINMVYMETQKLKNTRKVLETLEMAYITQEIEAGKDIRHTILKLW